MEDEFKIFCDMAEFSEDEKTLAKTVWVFAQRRLLDREEIYIRDLKALSEENELMKKRIERLSVL